MAELRPKTPDLFDTGTARVTVQLRRPGTAERPSTASNKSSRGSSRGSIPGAASTTSPSNFLATLRNGTPPAGAITLRSRRLDAFTSTINGFLTRTIQQATRLFMGTSAEVEILDTRSGTPSNFYNLDPELANVSGLKGEIMPLRTWNQLRTFCLERGITQADLEKLYERFRYSFESTVRPRVKVLSVLEETRQEGLKKMASKQAKNQRSRAGKKMYTVSLHSLQQDLYRSGVEEAVSVILYGMNECAVVPHLPPMSDDEKKAMEMNFAHFVMRAWQFCSPAEHKFIRLFLSVLLDKMDTEAYRPARSIMGDDDARISHSDFLNLLTALHHRPAPYFSIIDDQLFPQEDDGPGRGCGDDDDEEEGGEGARRGRCFIRLSELVRYCYLYPALVVPALAAQRALRRRVFGEEFWAQLQEREQESEDVWWLAASMDLPGDLVMRSLRQDARVPQEAEDLSLRMLCRSIYFQRDEQAIFDEEQEVQVATLRLMLRTRYGYRDAEFLLRRGLGVSESAPCVLADGETDVMTSSEGWTKVMDPKRKAHFFYNTYSGESTWDPPRYSRFHRIYVDENRRRVPLVDRRVKVARLMYYDDPLLVERREEARRAKQPKHPANVLRGALTTMRSSAIRAVTPLRLSREQAERLTASLTELKNSAVKKLNSTAACLPVGAKEEEKKNG